MTLFTQPLTSHSRTPLVDSDACVVYDVFNSASRPSNVQQRRDPKPYVLFDTVDHLRASILGENSASTPVVFQIFRKRLLAVEREIPRRVKELVELSDRKENARELDMDKKLALGLIQTLSATLQSPERQQRLLKHNQDLKRSDSLTDLLVSCQATIKLYSDFVDQKPFAIFRNFLIEKRFRKSGEVCVETLLDFGLTVEEMGRQIAERMEDCVQKQAIARAPDRFRQFPVIHWLGAIQGILHERYLEASDLKTASWTPQEGIEGLLALLRKQGCLLVTGLIGAHIFSKPPQESLNHPFGARKVVEWPDESEIYPSSFLTHCILLIGATGESSTSSLKGRVYFIDVTRRSDMDQIYSLSTQVFAERAQAIYYLAKKA